MYNVEQFIARAIESVANQSYENIEIICVDDCGSDRSVEIAKEFAVKDSRVKIVQNKENLKLYLARVNGVQHATSEYILNLDGDDYLHPDTCQKCYEILENANRGGQKQDIDFVMFNLLCQTKKDGEFKLCKVANTTQIIDDHTFEAMYFGQDTHFYNVVTKCIKRQTYLKALDFANVTRKFTIAEDILASMALLGVSKHIALLDCGLYYYCYNGDSATRIDDNMQERVENINFVIGKIDEFTNKKDEYYKVFMQGMCKLLTKHIVAHKTQRFVDSYHKRIEKGCPKWLARFILSMQRKPFGYKKRVRQWRKFVKENESVFRGVRI